MTVADLIESYIAKHVRTLRSKKDRERHLQVDVLPVIGGVKLAELHRRDVHSVLDVINERGCATVGTGCIQCDARHVPLGRVS